MTVPATTRPTHDAQHESRAAPGSLPAAGPEPPAASPAPWLAAILRCPLTGGTLIPVDAGRLLSDRPFRDGVHPVYRVSNGIACLRPLR